MIIGLRMKNEIQVIGESFKFEIQEDALVILFYSKYTHTFNQPTIFY